MEGLKRRLSFRKKKDSVPECSKPHQWQEDERKVREATCSFQVRYLGCIEVFESRGMQVCEDAVKALKTQCKGKYQRAILYVSGDALRVVDEISKGLIVDQTIEKVSFCAPDRHHEKGFAYICRDGTTRRWMCHGFLAIKESGERLSHAVGCAFAICLEKKQKREKDAVTVNFNDRGTTFERTGSFRQTTLTERLADPQSAIIPEPMPLNADKSGQANADAAAAVQRPHASLAMLERQGSFRGFSKLNETTSPFKRQLSLRVNELPSTLMRQQGIVNGGTSVQVSGSVSPIAEASPSKEESESITHMCQQLTQELGALSTSNVAAHNGFMAANFSNGHNVVASQNGSSSMINQVGMSDGALQSLAAQQAILEQQRLLLIEQQKLLAQKQQELVHQQMTVAQHGASSVHSTPPTVHRKAVPMASSYLENALANTEPIRQTNPWAGSLATSSQPSTPPVVPPHVPFPTPPQSAGPFSAGPISVVAINNPLQLAPAGDFWINTSQSSIMPYGDLNAGPVNGQGTPPVSAAVGMTGGDRYVNLNTIQVALQPQILPNTGLPGIPSPPARTSVSSLPGTTVDPFDAAWATHSSNQHDNITKSFELRL